MAKRPINSQSISPDHPAVAFHREVLIVQQWSLIRQSFLAELQSATKRGIAWKEPSKLWRHSQEALGKWILSQIARVKTVADSHEGDEHFDPYMASLHFFPTEEDVAAFSPNGGAYDEQLIRDLSIKSEGGAHDAAVQAAVKKLVVDFNLARRCTAAHEAVEAQLAEALRYAEEHATASVPFGKHLARPSLRRLEEHDSARSPSQRRVRGPIAEISILWPAHWSRQQTRQCPPVSVPWPALQKLKMTYTHFNRAGTAMSGSPHMDDDTSHDVHVPLSSEECFLYRAAVVALRYEGGLATGSLQLCADTSLKQHLHAQGYLVMDLCASPINAYMGRPAEGKFLSHEKSQAQTQQQTGSTCTPRPSSLEQEEAEERPNFFCSAFLDTDRYFGSLGSALRVDPLALYRSGYVNAAGAPLLLTLDVPYDEDLCEMLFQKLIRDMARAEKEPGSVRIDYVLVLPLWWSIPMKIDKHLFSDDAQVHAGSPRGQEEAVRKVVEERSAMLAEGYQVPYRWPEALASAAGDATAADSPRKQPWVCFDGLFVGNSGYAYFCTATNRWLQGVTATEVIGLQQPRPNAEDKMLAKSLEHYYLS